MPHGVPRRAIWLGAMARDGAHSPRIRVERRVLRHSTTAHATTRRRPRRSSAPLLHVLLSLPLLLLLLLLCEQRQGETLPQHTLRIAPSDTHEGGAFTLCTLKHSTAVHHVPVTVPIFALRCCMARFQKALLHDSTRCGAQGNLLQLACEVRRKCSAITRYGRRRRRRCSMGQG